MTRAARHPLGWAPAFVVGIACAVAAEVAVGLLLYSGPGFTRSLTTLLTVEALALAAGLRFPAPAPEVVDGLRRRWLLSLMAFLAATVFGTVWTLVPELGGGRGAQGIGLALLAALPLYACGALFQGLEEERRQSVDPPAAPPVAPVAALGAALGFALTGLLLPRAPTPSSLLVGCLVFLSLGGMAYGAVRLARPRRRVIAEGCVGPPPVRVEERVPAGAPWTEWALMEGDVTRATRRFRRDAEQEGSASSEVEASWDVQAVRDVAAGREDPEIPWRALFLGGGASLAPSEAVRLGADEVVVLERAHCVVDLGRSHFDTGLEQDAAAGRAPEALNDAGVGAEPDTLGQAAPGVEMDTGVRPTVVVGNLEDGLRGLAGPFHLVVVDGRVLDPVGNTTALSRWARETLDEMLAEEGVLVWGPKAAHHPRHYESAPGWAAQRRDQDDPLEEVLVVRRRAEAEAAVTLAERGPATGP